LANSVIPIIPEESRYTLVKPVTKDQVQMVKDIAEMMVIRPITPVSLNIMGILFEKCSHYGWFDWCMVFNTTFNNNSVILWWSVFIVEKT
jgi:hypothetical protein